MVKKSLQVLYTDEATIIKPITEIKGGRVVKKGAIQTQKVKCRLSYRDIENAQQNDDIPTIKQAVKLFVDSNIFIDSDSIVEVVRNGKLLQFTLAGEMALYPTHNEIPLRIKAVRVNGAK